MFLENLYDKFGLLIGIIWNFWLSDVLVGFWFIKIMIFFFGVDMVMVDFWNIIIFGDMY